MNKNMLKKMIIFTVFILVNLNLVGMQEQAQSIAPDSQVSDFRYFMSHTKTQILLTYFMVLFIDFSIEDSISDLCVDHRRDELRLEGVRCIGLDANIHNIDHIFYLLKALSGTNFYCSHYCLHTKDFNRIPKFVFKDFDRIPKLVFIDLIRYLILVPRCLDLGCNSFLLEEERALLTEIMDKDFPFFNLELPDLLRRIDKLLHINMKLLYNYIDIFKYFSNIHIYKKNLTAYAVDRYFKNINIVELKSGLNWFTRDARNKTAEDVYSFVFNKVKFT